MRIALLVSTIIMAAVMVQMLDVATAMMGEAVAAHEAAAEAEAQAALRARPPTETEASSPTAEASPAEASRAEASPAEASSDEDKIDWDQIWEYGRPRQSQNAEAIEKLKDVPWEDVQGDTTRALDGQIIAKRKTTVSRGGRSTYTRGEKKMYKPEQIHILRYEHDGRVRGRASEGTVLIEGMGNDARGIPASLAVSQGLLDRNGLQLISSDHYRSNVDYHTFQGVSHYIYNPHVPRK